jgi:hypothetical protein
VSKRVQTGALAAAALASIAVAGVRIAGAARTGHEPSDFDNHVRVYGTTPTLAAATLRRLRTPTGFRRGRCSGRPKAEEACFVRSPSITLDQREMRRLFSGMGVKPYSVYRATYGEPVSAVECSTTRYMRKVRRSLQLCHGEALAGDERLSVSAHSILAGAPASPHGSTRALQGWGQPTELIVFVVGHFLHEGLREGES